MTDRMHWLLCFWLLPLGCLAQKPLKFSELLTFSYTEGGKPAETSVYLDRKTSTWLFTPDDTFGGRAEGLDFVVAYANGTYLICSTGDTGQKTCQRFRVDYPKIATVSGKPTGKRRTFGKNNYGWPMLTSSEYTSQAGRMKLTAHLAPVPFNPYPVYAYNTLIGLEFPLPIFRQLNYATVVPRTQLVVAENLSGGATLVSLSPTEYFLDLRGYRVADAQP